MSVELDWTALAAPAASEWYSVCYGNGLFVAVADRGDYRIMTAEWAGPPEPPVIIDAVPSYSPQSIVNLVFQAGDSAEYPMGKFYVDRMHYNTNTEAMRIDARNSIGKYLKDQSFDERNSYEVTWGSRRMCMAGLLAWSWHEYWASHTWMGRLRGNS